MSLLILTAIVTGFCQVNDPIKIIERVDKNTVTEAATYRAKLVISIGGELREKQFKGYVQGDDRSYMEFTAPARDKGTRFLKLANEMWIYIPAVEKSTKIAGHMLRQSLMGSDFSYDDMMENRKLTELYGIELIGDDVVMEKTCFLLELIAKVEDVTYYKRRLWVDKVLYIPMKIELYAKSGKLMKEIDIYDYRRIGERNYPTRITMYNKLRQNTYSEMVIDDITLDEPIPAQVFTKAYLERK
jgi:outer membrane lipoprotein-sorting protein